MIFGFIEQGHHTIAWFGVADTPEISASVNTSIRRTQSAQKNVVVLPASCSLCAPERSVWGMNCCLSSSTELFEKGVFWEGNFPSETRGGPADSNSHAGLEGLSRSLGFLVFLILCSKVMYPLGKNVTCLCTIIGFLLNERLGGGKRSASLYNEFLYCLSFIISTNYEDLPVLSCSSGSNGIIAKHVEQNQSPA